MMKMEMQPPQMADDSKRKILPISTGPWDKLWIGMTTSAVSLFIFIGYFFYHTKMYNGFFDRVEEGYYGGMVYQVIFCIVTGLLAARFKKRRLMMGLMMGWFVPSFLMSIHLMRLFFLVSAF